MPAVVEELKEKQLMTVVGLVAEKTVKRTKNGDNMAFLTLEDKYGEIECIVFPKTFEEFAPMLVQDGIIAVCGEITIREEEPPKLIARAFAPLRTNGKYTPRPSPFTEIMNRSAGGRSGYGYARTTTAVPPSSRGYTSQNTSAPVDSQNRSGYNANASGAYGSQGTSGYNNAAKPLPTVKTPKYRPSVYDFKIAYGKLFVRVSESESEKYQKTVALLSIFAAEPGMQKAQVIFYDTETGKYTPHPELDCVPITFVTEELSAILGNENVVAKPLTTPQQ
jgi:hypothetical protein